MKKKAKEKSVMIETVIGSGTNITGNLRSDKSILINGIIAGNCEFTSNSIIGDTGVIVGNVKCEDIRIEGQIRGNVNAGSKTEILSTGKVYGDINTPVLVVDEGGIFEGKCSMNSSDDIGVEYIDLDKINDAKED